MAVPPMWTVPRSVVSRPARQCMRVDLPDPDGPMMAVKAPEANSTETSRSATTWASPEP